MLTTPKTQPERDLAEKDASILRAATALHYAAFVLQAENVHFWSLPDDRLLAVLNDSVPRTLAMFAANTAAGESINSLLDQIGDESLTHRAPTAPGRSDIGFADGEFFIVPPPPATEEDPTPDQDQ